ncbi:hypothetical protein B0T17DRAFT_218509 [Bombardia bombarda]|uniref:Zn(2)-C6 fungal-type domain-containing protein n=1 Tax=Bombardia bombarda TaxID=252184 RepID=A0AA39XAG0_9PEZI|nr:hypothetical protein B0T17DRAFT_218509 [Bombardia bombarda]
MEESPPGSEELPTVAAAKRRRRGGTRRKTGALLTTARDGAACQITVLHALTIGTIWPFPGCYTCKARHARCDEKKPVCSNCERLNLQCRAFEFIRRSVWCDTTETPTATPPILNRMPSGVTAGAEKLDISPAPAPVTTSPKSTWDIFNTCLPDVDFEEVVNVPSSSGSSTSQPPTTPIFTVGGSRLVSPGTFSQIDSQIVPLTAENAHLLTVYQAGVATWMDIFDHTCAYQREVPRRCLTSGLVLNSVCAFTAKNLSLLPSGDVWAATAARYYGDSLRMLIRYLNSSSPQSDALTATMLLCSYELIAARGHEHQRHCYGALTLITTHGITAQSLGMDRANFWIYIRHEITVALVNEVPLQINPTEWNVTWPEEGNVEEDVLGNQLLWLLGRAINVAYTPISHLSPGRERQEILTDAAMWFATLPVSFKGVKYGQPDDQGFNKIYYPVSAAAAAMMWYHMLHILLFAEPTLQHPSQIPQVQYHATEVANIALSDINQSVRSFSAQALFYAAKHISGIGKKTKLWTLLEDLEVRHGFTTRSRVHKLQQLVETRL